MKNNLFIFLTMFAFLGLYSCGDTAPKPVTNNETKTDSVVTTTTKTEDPTPTTDVDPMGLLKGEVLTGLLAGEMKDMELAKGAESILHTMYDVDEDGDKDLFMQAVFQKGETTKDVFVIYYNNEKPEVDPIFKAGFSTDNYHQLGSDAGDPSPCENCIFEKNEGNIFSFKDRASSSPLKFKLIRKEGIGLSWEKQ